MSKVRIHAEPNQKAMVEHALDVITRLREATGWAGSDLG